MKKILIIIIANIYLILGSFIFIVNNTTTNAYDIKEAIDRIWEFHPGEWVINLNNFYLKDGVKARTIQIMNNLIILWSLISIWWLIFAALRYVSSEWSEDKIKSAKNTAIWSVVWFIAMLLAFPITNAVVNLIYEIAW